jgi:hypothetical protein
MLLLHKYHSSPSGGDFSIIKCYAYLKQSYFLLDMLKYVKILIKSCLICQQNKVEQKRPVGLLQSLLILNKTWESISMDFTMGLQQNHSQFDAIFVVVDWKEKACRVQW